MCKERSRKLTVEVFYNNEYHVIYKGDLLFDAEPNGLPLILPCKYPQKIERLKITSLINEYFHLSKVNVLAIEKEEKPLFNKKIVFLKALSGLVDMLLQVQKCYEYAKKYNRDLYIDSTASGLLDSLDNYFIAVDRVYFGKPVLQNNIEYSYFPPCLTDLNYESLWNPTIRKNIHKQTSMPLTFDFAKPYEEDILVHEQGAVGGDIIKPFEWLRLNEKVRVHIVSIIEKLGSYDAVHVRNTDYKTDYKTFFENIKDKLGNKVVLCTDDLQCQLYAKSFFGDKLHIVTELPDTQGRPLHNNRNLDRYSINLNTLADLFILASGENLYFSTVLPDPYYSYTLSGTSTSSFSRLANALHERPDLVKKILYGGYQIS
jgi:hypothetical protein